MGLGKATRFGEYRITILVGSRPNVIELQRGDLVVQIYSYLSGIMNLCLLFSCLFKVDGGGSVVAKLLVRLILQSSGPYFCIKTAGFRQSPICFKERLSNPYQDGAGVTSKNSQCQSSHASILLEIPPESTYSH